MISILLVEDNFADARLVEIALTNTNGVHFNVNHVERLSQALQKLGEAAFDAILLDLSLPDSQGLDSVNQVRVAAPGVPIVVLSGHADEARALEAVKSGAQDYLVKGQGDNYLLPRAIRYAIERHRAETELQRAKNELERRVEERTSHLLREISTRKQAEKRDKQRMLELAHVSRLSNMGEMATEIAHELNQPLTAISNYGNACLRMLNSGQWSLEDMVKGFQAIVKQAKRSADIIQNLHEFVRKADGGRSHSSINELVSSVTNLVQVEAGPRQVEIRLELTDGLPPFVVNKVLIEQVILNLMRNAIEAMEELGEQQQRILTFQTSLASDDSVEALVKDTGPGLSEQAMQDVFMPFFTTKAQGIGMGLSICRSIIEEHGGRIWVEANYPQGAAFRFTLPAA